MSIAGLFDGLEMPSGSNPRLYNVRALPDYPIAKVGINVLGYPAVLIASSREHRIGFSRNVKLKFLELENNVECKLSEAENTTYSTHTVISFVSEDTELQHYFLEVCEVLLRSIAASATAEDILSTFRRFINIFSSVSETPTKTLHGLWAELFVIESSADPTALLRYWHSEPEGRFDFNADAEKLEVKSSAALERVHTFALEQLNPPTGDQVVVASLFVKHHSNGVSIKGLLDSIAQSVNDVHLLQKLFGLVAKTMGNGLEQSIKAKFDYALAKRSIKYYKHQDIQKISIQNVPSKVSQVKFRSDLSPVPAVAINTLSLNGLLFQKVSALTVI